MKRLAILAVAIGLLLCGCSSGSKTIEIAALDAELTTIEAYGRIKAADLPVGSFIDYNKETDPNEIMGDEGKYNAKLDFQITAIEQGEDDFNGGSIEIFANSDDAVERKQYIDSLGLLGEEHSFVIGNILLRIDKRIDSSDAAKYKNAILTEVISEPQKSESSIPEPSSNSAPSISLPESSAPSSTSSDAPSVSSSSTAPVSSAPPQSSSTAPVPSSSIAPPESKPESTPAPESSTSSSQSSSSVNAGSDTTESSIASSTQKLKGGNHKDENMNVVTPLSEIDKFSVFWGNTGDKVHISPNCSTIKNGVWFGTLDDCKNAGHTEGWCGRCSKGLTDEQFLKSGNPNIG